MSHEFVGETQGVPFSAYIVKAEPGQGPPLRKHPYVEVAVTLEGCATITADTPPASVFPCPASQLRKGAWLRQSFTLSTTCRAVATKADQFSTFFSPIGIHASPRFIQTNLT